MWWVYGWHQKQFFYSNPSCCVTLKKQKQTISTSNWSLDLLTNHSLKTEIKNKDKKKKNFVASTFPKLFWGTPHTTAAAHLRTCFFFKEVVILLTPLLLLLLLLCLHRLTLQEFNCLPSTSNLFGSNLSIACHSNSSTECSDVRYGREIRRGTSYFPNSDCFSVLMCLLQCELFPRGGRSHFIPHKFLT